jgi:hypothetical protein
VIEDRISNAIADIRLELFRGNRDPKVIAEIAAAYDLQPCTLSARLAKAYGSLEDMDRWQEKSVSMSAIEARMREAIHAYAETEAGVEIGKWLEERAGRAPSRAEVELADELWVDRAFRKMVAGRE